MSSRQLDWAPVLAVTIGQRVLILLVVGIGSYAGLRAPAMVHPAGLLAEKVRNETGGKIMAMDAIIVQFEVRLGRHGGLLDNILAP